MAEPLLLLPAVLRGDMDGAAYPILPPRNADSAGGLLCVERLALKHEGENPTASFKDRGMTGAISHACHAGATTVACASSGNTSASLAAYAAKAGMRALTFIPEGKITAGKLGQTLAYGAQVVQGEGDFDAAVTLVQEVAATEPLFLAHNNNPFPLGRQKAIALLLLPQRP